MRGMSNWGLMYALDEGWSTPGQGAVRRVDKEQVLPPVHDRWPSLLDHPFDFRHVFQRFLHERAGMGGDAMKVGVKRCVRGITAFAAGAVGLEGGEAAD